jgi:hypothetical protein
MIADRLGYLAGREALTWTLTFASVGIVFLVLLLGKRQHYWWAVWPTCLFLSLAALIYLTANDILPGDLAASGFLFVGIALPFWLVLILKGRDAWWASIPAGAMTFIALAIGLEPLVGGDWVGVIVLWGIAIPFWLVFFFNRSQWWALIPAGTLTTVGVMPLVGGTGSPGFIVAVLFGGLALTFLLIYLLPGQRQELKWALWPAGGCALLAVLAPLFGTWYDLVWPTLLIIGGGALLVFGFRSRRR